MELAAPKPEATPLVLTYQPIAALPKVNSNDVTALPNHTSGQPTR